MKFAPLAMMVLLTLISACGPRAKVMVHTTGNPLISVKAGKSAMPKFNAEDPASLDLAAANQIYLKIKPQALGSLFLMSVAEISAPPAPTGQALANKVVSFERRASRLFMFENLEGKLATNNVATKVLLAEFPILESDDEWITFDLKSGLNLVYQKRSLQAAEGRSNNEDHVLTLTHSFIDKVEMRGPYIFVNQFARAELPASKDSPSKNVSIHLKYVFQSYVPSSDYTAKKSIGLDKIGFFETDTVLTAGSGEENIYIMRQHPKKSITWYLAGPIPAAHKQAVRDGVLYWNQIFGTEKIQVKDLPADISVHEPGYNIVQWLEWDTAGFAYANIHGDPLTGEVLQGHVYMTSVFGKLGVRDAKKFFEQLALKTPAPTSAFGIGLQGWASAETCQFEHTQALAGQAAALLKNIDELNEEEQEAIFLRVANDYIRSVVAHEIGHALGLRHNFAGSLQTSLDAKNYNEKTLAYFLRDELANDEEIASTVMDYTPLLTSAMTGAAIRKRNGLYAYDKAAISWGHKDQNLAPTLPLFCTDGDRSAKKYHDCQIWDRFGNSLESVHSDYEERLDNLAYATALKFKGLIDYTNDTREFLLNLKLAPIQDAKKFSDTTYPTLIEALGAKTQFLTVKGHLASSGDLYQDLEEALELEYLSGALKSIGKSQGKLFFESLTPDQTGMTPLRQKLETQTMLYANKILADESQEDRDLVKAEVSKYAHLFERELLINFSLELSKAELRPLDTLDWEDHLKFFAEGTLFNQRELTLDENTTIKAKTFDYRRGDEDLRAQIVKAISSPHFGKKPSHQRARTGSLILVQKRHKEEMDALAPLRDRLSDDAYNYFIWEQQRFAPIEALFK